MTQFDIKIHENIFMLGLGHKWPHSNIYVCMYTTNGSVYIVFNEFNLTLI